MVWLKLIKKLFKALNAEASPSEIAGGVILGCIIGLTPTFTLHNLIVVFLIIILKVNISAAIFSSILFGILGFAVDPLSHFIGQKLLLFDWLTPFWTALYNMPIIALSKFNNTIVLGSLIISIIIMLPLFKTTKKLVIKYREKLKYRVEKLKIIQILKSSKIYQLYRKVKI
ncbi:MAG: TIGR03546 family protein [Elusimicrobiota bacterium]